MMKCIDEVYDNHNNIHKVMISSNFKPFGIKNQVEEIHGKLKSKDRKVSIIGLVGMEVLERPRWLNFFTIQI